MSNIVEPFFKIVPYDNKYLEYNIGYIPLKVLQESGVEVIPDLHIHVNDLNANKGTLYKHFYNQGSGGITFKIEVIIHKDEVISGEYPDNINTKVTEVLDYLISTMTPIMVKTSAIDINESLYIITKNSSRKQTYRGYTVWNLEFTTYNALTLVKFKNDNTMVKNALKKTKSVKKKSATKLKLKKCKLSHLKYSKKKKTVKCVKLMQKVLYKKKCLKNKGNIDGWYGKVTLNAVKKFQKKYKKAYKLKVTGKVDKKTFEAMCKV